MLKLVAPTDPFDGARGTFSDSRCYTYFSFPAKAWTVAFFSALLRSNWRSLTLGFSPSHAGDMSLEKRDEVAGEIAVRPKQEGLTRARPQYSARRSVATAKTNLVEGGVRLATSPRSPGKHRGSDWIQAQGTWKGPHPNSERQSFFVTASNPPLRFGW